MREIRPVTPSELTFTPPQARNAQPQAPAVRAHLSIQIGRVSEEGSFECLYESPTVKDGNHIRLIFEGLHELFALDYSPEELDGVVVKTFTNGEEEASCVYRLDDVKLAYEQYERGLLR